MKLSFQRGLIVTTLIGSSFLFLSSVQAASACKGLEQTVCETEQYCGWVKGYSRKDGREVKAFCRAKSKAANNKVSDKTLAEKPVAVK